MNPIHRTILLHSILFVATFGTTTLAQGPIYAVGIMGILLAHEFGHYWTCRRYGVEATFPIFLPMPSPLLGTMGAVIAIKSPIPDRKALFDIGIAGPLLGLLIALPTLALGLSLSEFQTIPADFTGYVFGESPLFQFISQQMLGPKPAGKDLVLHPLAYAGWASMFVTSMNFFPIGQLDGGHVAHALLGPRGGRIASWVTASLLFYLGARYHPMWFVFLAVILLFMLKHPQPVDDTIRVGGWRRWLGVASYLLIGLCFTAVPFELIL